MEAYSYFVTCVTMTPGISLLLKIIRVSSEANCKHLLQGKTPFNDIGREEQNWNHKGLKQGSNCIID